MFDPSWNADGSRYEPKRRRRRLRLGRFLAPIALLVVIGGTYVIVSKGIRSLTSTTSSSTVHTVKKHHGLTKAQRRYAHDTFYRVKSGESLTSIAAKTGVSVRRLQQLNPHVNPRSLQLGQRLRLRR